MPNDWSRIAPDELIASRYRRQGPQGLRTPSIRAPRTDAVDAASLAVKSLLAGVMATLLYVWPVEFATYLLSGGFSGFVFVSVLVISVAAGTTVSWIITMLEKSYWDRNWHTVSEWADPPYWR